MTIQENWESIKRNTENLKKMVEGEVVVLDRKFTSNHNAYDRAKEGYCKRCDRWNLQANDKEYVCKSCQKIAKVN